MAFPVHVSELFDADCRHKLNNAGKHYTSHAPGVIYTQKLVRLGELLGAVETRGWQFRRPELGKVSRPDQCRQVRYTAEGLDNTRERERESSNNPLIGQSGLCSCEVPSTIASSLMSGVDYAGFGCRAGDRRFPVSWPTQFPPAIWPCN